jgi:cytochrome c553
LGYNHEKISKMQQNLARNTAKPAKCAAVLFSPRAALATVASLQLFLWLSSNLPAHAQGGASVAECAACHGEDGIGKDVEIPNLAGQHEVYLYRQLQHFKSGKRSHKEMRFESRQLSDADMQALAHYYSQLPR